MLVEATAHASFEKAQEVVLARLRARIDRAIDIPTSRILEYGIKREEVMRFVAEQGAGEYDFIDAEAKETGKTRVQVAQGIKREIDAWVLRSSKATAYWQKVQERVANATTRSQLRNIEQGVVDRLAQIDANSG